VADESRNPEHIGIDPLGKKPPSVEDIDDLGKLKRDSSRVLAFASISLSAAVLLLVIVGGAIAISANGRLTTANNRLSDTNAKLVRQDDVLTTAVSNTCSFFSDIATLPLETTGPNKAGKVSVRLIVDSRSSYTTKLCARPLPPIPDSVKQLARQYGISLTDPQP
jgi:hypothetical protein